MLLMFVSAAAGSAITLAPLLHYLRYLGSQGGQYHADPKLTAATITAYCVAFVLSVCALLLVQP